MLTLLNSQDTPTPRQRAVDLFCYQIAKQIGGLAAALGGVNSLIFAGALVNAAARFAGVFVVI